MRLVEMGDDSVLFDESADIVAPCATGGILNEDTIPQIKAKIVCGAANNQLLDEVADDARLRDAGITYVADFLASEFSPPCLIVSSSEKSQG